MSVALDLGTRAVADEAEDLKGRYLVSLKLVERLHRLLLDVIKDEFERLGRADVNSVQALLLYNIGDAELTAGELTSRGYLGSNVSYNLKKLVDAGYIHHQRSKTDRRSVRVSLTDKGQEVCMVVNGLYQRQLKSLQQVGGLAPNDLETLNKALIRLERFWTDQIRYQPNHPRRPRPAPRRAMLAGRSASDRAPHAIQIAQLSASRSSALPQRKREPEQAFEDIFKWWRQRSATQSQLSTSTGLADDGQVLGSLVLK
jgi:DNA-binding MarR family transcriptional regulator